jgi:hypothetical protein
MHLFILFLLMTHTHTKLYLYHYLLCSLSWCHTEVQCVLYLALLMPVVT